MRHNGTKKLETDRLLLRRIYKEDALEMYNGFINQEGFLYYLNKEKRTLEEEISSLEMIDEKNKNEDYYNWVITLKDTGKIIGMIVLNLEEVNECVEATYAIDERYCNNCGQNNEGYVERKPIEKVEIYHQQPNNTTYSQPQPTYHQTNIYQQTNSPVTKPGSGVTTAAKVFMIIGTVLMAISTYLIGLAWCIPMCIYYFNRVKDGQPIGTGFKVCSLLFVSLLGGILMLCDKDH